MTTLTRSSLIRCTKRHHVDHDDEAGKDRYAQVGTLGIVTDDHAALSNPFEIVWENGAWGFYTAEEVAAVADVVMLEGQDFTIRDAPKNKQRLWAVVIHHERGDNLYIARTEARAKEIVHDYVKSWWGVEIPDEPMPALPSEAVSGYFERVEGEYAVVEQVEVL